MALAGAVACTSPPRDLDMMVWTRTGWDPGQEQVDYGQCFEHAKKAAYRNVHWRRVAVSREVEQISAGQSAAVLSRLQDIAADEKAAAAMIAEQCMIARGYALVPIDKATP